MNLQDLTQEALKIKQAYDLLNQQKRGVTWSGKDFVAGFAGDVGDLVKIIMAKEGLRDMQDVDQKLAHELSDCLWAVLILADYYKVDLESAFTKNMSELSAGIERELEK